MQLNADTQGNLRGKLGRTLLVLRPAPERIANAVIHLSYWTCNYYGGAGRNITFSYWRRWRASVSKAHQIRRTDRCLKRPSLSKKFAYKPSFIAAVRVNVSDLIPLLNKGRELFVENAKNKAFLKVATLVADHSARWSAFWECLTAITNGVCLLNAPKPIS